LKDLYFLIELLNSENTKTIKPIPVNPIIEEIIETILAKLA